MQNSAGTYRSIAIYIGEHNSSSVFTRTFIQKTVAKIFLDVDENALVVVNGQLRLCQNRLCGPGFIPHFSFLSLGAARIKLAQERGRLLKRGNKIIIRISAVQSIAILHFLIFLNWKFCHPKLSLNCIGLHHLMSKPPAITTLPFLILQAGQP